MKKIIGIFVLAVFTALFVSSCAVSSRNGQYKMCKKCSRPGGYTNYQLGSR